MISQREVERQYHKLSEKVKKDSYYNIDLNNRVNCYSCDCGHITKTKDVDAGVTPFIHNCEMCGKMAKSSFYNDTHPDLLPTQEWYRPSLNEVLKLRSKPHVLDHVFNGGLMSRKISGK